MVQIILIKVIILNNSFKLLSEKLFQTKLTKYYLKSLEKNLQTIVRLSIQTILTNLSEKKKSFQTVLRESDNTYKLLSEKSFQTILTNDYQRTSCKMCLQESIRGFNSFQRIFSIYSSFITDNFLKYMIRKFITDNTFKSCLKPATIKGKGYITVQNTKFFVDNQKLQ